MGETVLLVDHDPLSIRRIREVLGRAGLRIRLSIDGRTAVADWREVHPDLLLVQDSVRSMSGLEVCRRIKDTPDGAERPVVILAAPREHDELVATGCDAYVVKPFHDEELLRVVQALFPSSRQLPAVNAGTERSAPPLPACPVGQPAELTEEDIEARLSEVLPEARRSPAVAIVRAGHARAPATLTGRRPRPQSRPLRARVRAGSSRASDTLS